MSFKVIDSSGTINETISLEIAKCVGVWREMVGSEHSKDDDTPVCLDDDPDILKLLMSYLFHRPDYIVTEENAERLLELTAKYEIPTMAEDIGRWITSMDLVTPQYAYVLGASFGVSLLEDRNRPYVIIHFNKWLQSPQGQQEWNTLERWGDKSKLFELVREAMKNISSRSERQETILNSTLPKATELLARVVNTNSTASQYTWAEIKVSADIVHRTHVNVKSNLPPVLHSDRVSRVGIPDGTGKFIPSPKQISPSVPKSA